MPPLARTARPLLSRVGGKPRSQYGKGSTEDTEDLSAGASDSSRQELSTRNPKGNVDPISDERSLEKGSYRSLSHLDDSDDSDHDGRPERGGIKTTRFVSSKETGGNRRNSDQQKPSQKNNGKEVTQNANSAKRRRLDGGSNIGARGSKPPTSSQQTSSSNSGRTPTSSNEHLLDSHGWIKKTKVRETFGAKGTKRNERWRTTGSQEKKTSRKNSSVSEDKAKAKTQDVSSTGFRVFLSEDEDSPVKNNDFKKPEQTPDFSPSKGSVTEFRAVKDEESDDSSSTLRPNLGYLSPGAPSRIAKSKKKRSKRKSEPGESEPESQAPVFRMFNDDLDLDIPIRDRNGSESPISDLDSNNEDIQAEPEDVEEVSASSAAACPWCGELVDGQLLEDFSKGRRMNVRQQTRFCQQHKRQAAQEAWGAKSYPTIDWVGLPARISTHYDSLLEVVNGSKESYYRAKLAEKIEAGQDRAMRKEENLNPGYYGPRGFNLMCDCLVDHFGDLLKQKAIHDRVISGRGSAAFIQSVLVAELAVQLIKEDMGVSDAEALEIMEDSKAIGDMIHEEA